MAYLGETVKTKYTTEHFDTNGPKIINRHGDWGVFIDGKQIDGPYFNRQDALNAYAEHLRERAEAERIFASGIEWDAPLADDEMASEDFYWQLQHGLADQAAWPEPMFDGDEVVF